MTRERAKWGKGTVKKEKERARARGSEREKAMKRGISLNLTRSGDERNE